MTEKKIFIEFKVEKETKNTIRYQEDSDDPIIRTLYIQKKTAKELGNPEKLIVTIEAGLI